MRPTIRCYSPNYSLFCSSIVDSLPIIVTMAIICTMASRSPSSTDAFKAKLQFTTRKGLNTVVLCSRPHHSQPISGSTSCIERCGREAAGAVVFQSVERIRSSFGCAMADNYTGLGSMVGLDDDLCVLLGLWSSTALSVFVLPLDVSWQIIIPGGAARKGWMTTYGHQVVQHHQERAKVYNGMPSVVKGGNRRIDSLSFFVFVLRIPHRLSPRLLVHL